MRLDNDSLQALHECISAVLKTHGIDVNEDVGLSVNIHIKKDRVGFDTLTQGYERNAHVSEHPFYSVNVWGNNISLTLMAPMTDEELLTEIKKGK